MNQLQDFKEEKKELYQKPCPRCGAETYLTKAGQHIKWSCVSCGYIKFLAQSIINFHMPIGKYKGKLLVEIYKDDPEYLIWANENMKNNVGKRIKEFLERIKNDNKES